MRHTLLPLPFPWPLLRMASFRRSMATIAARPTLAHKVIEHNTGATQTCFVLHGLLGSGRNWLSFTRGLAPLTPKWRYVLLDTRNHGSSTGFAAPHSLAACVDDVTRFVAAHPSLRPHAVTGHSLGGKIVMELLRHSPSTLDTSSGRAPAFILDSIPGALQPRSVAVDAAPAADSVESVLSIVASAPNPIPDRAWVTRTCEAQGVSKGITAWLASNVVANSAAAAAGGYQWAFDPTTAASLYASYLSTNSWDVLLSPPAHVDVHLVVATRSSRWGHSDMQAQLAAAVRAQQQRDATPRTPAGAGTFHVHQLDSGHWVHVDNPAGLSKLLCARLQ